MVNSSGGVRISGRHLRKRPPLTEQAKEPSGRCARKGVGMFCPPHSPLLLRSALTSLASNTHDPYLQRVSKYDLFQLKDTTCSQSPFFPTFLQLRFLAAQLSLYSGPSTFGTTFPLPPSPIRHTYLYSFPLFTGGTALMKEATLDRRLL